MKGVFTNLAGDEYDVEVLDRGEDDHGPYVEVRFVIGDRKARVAASSVKPTQRHTEEP